MGRAIIGGERSVVLEGGGDTGAVTVLFEQARMDHTAIGTMHERLNRGQLCGLQTLPRLRLGQWCEPWSAA